MLQVNYMVMKMKAGIRENMIMETAEKINIIKGSPYGIILEFETAPDSDGATLTAEWCEELGRWV